MASGTAVSISDSAEGDGICDAISRTGRTAVRVTIAAVPIIVFALLFFVLLSFGSLVLLSLALRYRAGTARRQGRRWVASLNVWLTSFSALFFLLYAGDFFLGRLRLSICSDWYELWRDSWLARSGSDPLGKTTGRTFLHAEPLARTSGHPSNCGTFCVNGRRRAAHSGPSGEQHLLVTASGTQLSLAVAAGLIGYYLVYSVGVRISIARHGQVGAD